MTPVALLAALVLGLSSQPVAPSAAAHTGAKAFCASPGPRDYAAPLANLPPINRIHPGPKEHPGLGNLPFGPRGIEMYVDTEGPVIVRPEKYGVAFWDVGYLGNKPETHSKLDWLVTAQMVALDSSGASLDEVAHGHIRIGRIDNAYQPSLNLPVPDRLGFYRFDVQIAGADGNLLGSYSEYLRVVAPSLKVRLGINDRQFRPGQTLATRPEELGTEWISFGESFEVQRRSGSRWRSYSSLLPGIWALWRGFVGPGGAGRCSSLHIPIDTPAGRYRVVQTVGVNPSGKRGHGLTLTAPFSVSGNPYLPRMSPIRVKPWGAITE